MELISLKKFEETVLYMVSTGTDLVDFDGITIGHIFHHEGSSGARYRTQCYQAYAVNPRNNEILLAAKCSRGVLEWYLVSDFCVGGIEPSGCHLNFSGSVCADLMELY